MNGGWQKRIGFTKDWKSPGGSGLVRQSAMLDLLSIWANLRTLAAIASRILWYDTAWCFFFSGLEGTVVFRTTLK